jgi:predicted PurR-regulated permease PerM
MRILFLIFFGIIILFLSYIFRSFLWVFLFAFIFYIVLRPLHDRLLSLIPIRLLSSTIVIIILFVIFLLPLTLLLVLLTEQAMDMYRYIQIRIDSNYFAELGNSSAVLSILDYLNITKDEVVTKFMNFIQRTSTEIFSGMTFALSYPVTFAIKLFFMLITLFFLLKDGYRLDGLVYKVLPFPDDIEKEIIDKLKNVLYLLVVGNLFIMSLQGLMVGLGLYLAGISMPLLWGSLAAVLSLIPVIGTIFIWAPAALFYVFSRDYGTAIFIAVWCFSWYMILENLAKPKIFGDKLNFHPLLLFFLLIGSIQTFGLPGVIIGPLFLSLFFSFWSIYKILDAYDMDRKIRGSSADEADGDM